MTSRRRLRRNQCGDKDGYDEWVAIKIAKRIRRKGIGAFNAYRCRWCGQWHVGRPSKRVLQAMRAKREG